MGIIKRKEHKDKTKRSTMSSQIKLIDSMAQQIGLPKLQSTSSQEKVRAHSTRSVRHSSSTQSNELLKIPNKDIFHVRSTSRGIEKSIAISDDSVSTTAASCLMSQNPSSSAAIITKALSAEIENSSLDSSRHAGIMM